MTVATLVRLVTGRWSPSHMTDGYVLVEEVGKTKLTLSVLRTKKKRCEGQFKRKDG